MACGRVLVLLSLVAAIIAPRAALADPIAAGVAANAEDGYARLVFNTSAYDKASVRKEGNVLIISFEQPIAISVDRLSLQVPGYINAARRDPDGMAVRVALAQKLTVNSMSADKQFFVDLLPDTWHGPPPSLPQEVIASLAARAHQAERLAEQNRLMEELLSTAPVHVRVASEPTFTRYFFDVPKIVSVAAHRAKSDLTLTFDAPLRFDLADAHAALPSAVAGIDQNLTEHSANVTFKLNGKIDVRTFRDADSYDVDIVTPANAPRPAAVLQGGTLKIASPSAVPTVAARPAVPAVAPPPAPAAAESAQTTKPALAPPKALAVAAPAPPPPALAAAPAANPPAPAKPAPEPAKPVTAAASAPPHSAMTPAPAAMTPPPKPVAEPVKPRVAAAAPQPHRPATAARIAADLSRQNGNLTLTFGFVAPVAAAVFNRADTLWIVFDSRADIDLSALKDEATHTIRSAELTRAPDADIVRIKLDRPRLASATAAGSVWTVQIGDSVAAPIHALDLSRNMAGRDRASIVIPMAAPHELHRIVDPEAGDQLLVVTAFGPARGLIRTQSFLEFRALASEQGVVIEPLADNVEVSLAPDKVVIERPGGLTLSSSLQKLLGGGLQPGTFSAQAWGYDRKGPYFRRESQLITDAAEAPKGGRLQPRLALARFYLARSMYPEAEGVLNVAIGDLRPGSQSVVATVLRAVTEIMMERPKDALKDLEDPSVGNQHDAPLWRALAYAELGDWARAREGFGRVETAIAPLPVELQRFALREEMRAAIELKDYAAAENVFNDLQTLGIPHDMQPAMSVLVGRLDEGMGRAQDALAAYRAAADSWDRPAAAQGKLRETLLRYKLGDLNRSEVVSALESLTTVWRGDETELQALAVLARLYTEEGRYRDSFYVMRSAMAAHPDWAITRQIEDEAAKTFDSLFLAGKGDSLSAIDALSLFYDFRELTPVGSRGDEMIRRLADRLVSLDLLDQAAGLLQYQVDKRLRGAARAEVATRLAVIYLLDRKPDRALATLRATDTADLAGDVRDERLLLEARALSDLGRHALAIEVVADLRGRVVMRLRSDIYWAAHDWDKAAEEIEAMYGHRWKEWRPLSDVERSDILRAEIGYALAQDKLGLDRFRDEYAAKMAGTPDAHAFQVVSAPLGTGGEDFKNIANAAAASDTLDDFLRDMRARYPESSPISPPAQTSSTSYSEPRRFAEEVAPVPTQPPLTRPVAMP